MKQYVVFLLIFLQRFLVELFHPSQRVKPEVCNNMLNNQIKAKNHEILFSFGGSDCCFCQLDYENHVGMLNYTSL